MTIKKFKSW